MIYRLFSAWDERLVTPGYQLVIVSVRPIYPSFLPP